MCAPSPPPAPDYAGAATAQGQANVDAARATAKLSNPNVISPYGTQKVEYGRGIGFDQKAFDAATAKYTTDLAAYNKALAKSKNGGKGLVKPTAPVLNDFPNKVGPDQALVTQTFSPEQQALYDKSIQTKKLMGDLGVTGATALQDVVGKNLDISSAPSQRPAFDPSLLSPMPDNAEATRATVIDAMMGRVNRDFTQRQDQTNSDLIAAGIRPGTEAYSRAMMQLGQQRNDATQQAILAGGQEASRDYSMDMGRRTQGAAEQAQAFAQSDAARRQAIAEILSQRQTPLNEINALTSGAQVTNPFAAGLGYQAGANVQPAPIFDATKAKGAWDQNAYAQGVGQSNSMMSGLFSLGSAAIGAPTGTFKF